MGKVFLVGAGPGDPELLTVKALRVLQRADVVLHDSLVSAGILALISPDAQIVDVGKRAGQKLLSQEEINLLLVDFSSKRETVVRLKGGDPLLFGRAAEEMAALRLANVAFEVVPGISAAFAAAASAGFSLTDRRAASQVLLTTFSRGESAEGLGWGEVTADTTLAIYMPGADYAEVAAHLLDAGLDVDTPCAVISQATRAEQQIRWSSIGALFEERRLPAPAILIVGRVATQDVRAIGEKISAVSFGKQKMVSGGIEDVVPQSWVKN